MIWVLESDVFPHSHTALRTAIRQRRERIVEWHDDWLSDVDLPAFADSPVVAGSAYDARTRQAVNEPTSSHSWEFAAKIAAELPPPDDVYVLDLCESAGEIRLLELNPFSGADLYASSGPEIVAAVSSAAVGAWKSRIAS